MFDIINHGSYVEWNGFVNSDGFPTDSDPDEKIDIQPFCFEMGEYQKAISLLQKLIHNKFK